MTWKVFFYFCDRDFFSIKKLLKIHRLSTRIAFLLWCYYRIQMQSLKKNNRVFFVKLFVAKKNYFALWLINFCLLLIDQRWIGQKVLITWHNAQSKYNLRRVKKDLMLVNLANLIHGQDKKRLFYHQILGYHFLYFHQTIFGEYFVQNQQHLEWIQTYVFFWIWLHLVKLWLHLVWIWLYVLWLHLVWQPYLLFSINCIFLYPIAIFLPAFTASCLYLGELISCCWTSCIVFTCNLLNNNDYISKTYFIINYHFFKC